MFVLIAAAISAIVSIAGQSYANSRARVANLIAGYTEDKSYEAQKTLDAYTIIEEREKQKFIIMIILGILVLTVATIIVLKHA